MGPSTSYRQIFRPIGTIDARVEAITSKFAENTVGLHIRGTDSPWAKLYCSISAFENRIDETIL